VNSVTLEIQAFEDGFEVRHICAKTHYARGLSFQLHVCKFTVDEGQMRVWIFKDSAEIQGSIYDPAHDFNCLPGSHEEAMMAEELLSKAIEDINENRLNMY